MSCIQTLPSTSNMPLGSIYCGVISAEAVGHGVISLVKAIGLVIFDLSIHQVNIPACENFRNKFSLRDEITNTLYHTFFTAAYGLGAINPIAGIILVPLSSIITFSISHFERCGNMNMPNPSTTYFSLRLIVHYTHFIQNKVYRCVSSLMPRSDFDTSWNTSSFIAMAIFIPPLVYISMTQAAVLPLESFKGYIGPIIAHHQ